MEQEGATVVELSSKGDLRWTFQGAQVAVMGRATVHRSPCLITLCGLLEQDEGCSAPVCLPSNVDLQAWLEFVATQAQHDSDRPVTDAEGLIQVLLVRIRHLELF